MRGNKIKILFLISFFTIFTTIHITYLNLPNIVLNRNHSPVEEVPIRISNDISLVWGSNGTEVCTQSGSQFELDLISDEAGGVIIVWADARGANYNIYAQKLNSNGDTQWTSNGVAICTAGGYQMEPQLCSDGDGGAIIVWQDDRGANVDIYSQRIASNGSVLWTPNGILVMNSSDHEYSPQLCSDGDGGAIITWRADDVFAQRVNSKGVLQWTDMGVLICNHSYSEAGEKILSDGFGGAFITWMDYDGSDYNIYAQRIDFNGNRYWTFNGVPVCTESTQDYSPQLCSDGANGTIIIWLKGDLRTYAQRINSFGTSVWTANGIDLCEAMGNQKRSQICSDGQGGAIATWEDYRSGSYPDIYAQKINSLGDLEWDSEGLVICDETGYQMSPQICTNGAGGAYITWTDARLGYSDFNVYLQVVNSSGDIQGPISGQVICNETNNQGYIEEDPGPPPRPVMNSLGICYDGAGSVFLAWVDDRNGVSTQDIFCDYVTSGSLSAPILDAPSPNPSIDGIFQLNWSVVSFAAFYYLYRAQTTITNITGLMPIAQTTDSNFTDFLIVNGEYFYVIVAGNILKNSSISNCQNVTVSIPINTPFLCPILPETNKNGIVELKWSEVSNATRYYIYRDTSYILSIEGLDSIASITITNFTDYLTISDYYFYAIVSGDGWVNSSVSNCQYVLVTISLESPFLFPILPGSDTDGIINLDWNEIDGAAFYYVYRDTSYITSTEGLAPIVNITDTNYTDILAEDGFFYYAIVAGTATQNSSLSNCNYVLVALTINGQQHDYTWLFILIAGLSITGAIIAHGFLTRSSRSVSSSPKKLPLPQKPKN